MIDCPSSIVGLDGVIEPAARPGFTVTKKAAEVTLTDGLPVELSVTV
jgi:hypothetical protein